MPKMQRETLLAAIKSVSEAAAKKTTKPVLRCIRLRPVADGRVRIDATNLEQSASVIVAAEDASGISDAGVMLDPKVSDILAAGQVDDVTLWADGNSLKIQCDGASYSLPTEDVQTFPDIPTSPEDGKQIGRGMLPVCDLLACLRAVLHAGKSEAAEGRYLLSGVHLGISGSHLVATATDTKRIARQTSTNPLPATEDGIIGVVPVVFAKLLERGLKSLNPGDECTLAWDRNQLWVVCGSQQYHTRLMEGIYPPVDQIIPDAAKCRKILHGVAGEIAASVRQAALMTDEETRRVTLSYSEASGGYTVSAQSSAGSGDVGLFAGIEAAQPDADISIDPRFLLDALSALPDAAEVEIRQKKKDMPLTLTSGNFTSMIMPLT